MTGFYLVLLWGWMVFYAIAWKSISRKCHEASDLDCDWLVIGIRMKILMPESLTHKMSREEDKDVKMSSLTHIKCGEKKTVTRLHLLSSSSIMQSRKPNSRKWVNCYFWDKGSFAFAHGANHANWSLTRNCDDSNEVLLLDFKKMMQIYTI